MTSATLDSNGDSIIEQDFVGILLEFNFAEDCFKVLKQ